MKKEDLLGQMVWISAFTRRERFKESEWGGASKSLPRLGFNKGSLATETAK